MPFQIIRQDIARMHVDAIVNASNEALISSGGVDRAIHSAAGPQLMEACHALGGCRVGEAKITDAYCLPCRFVIHTVGPKWRGGLLGERRLLASCYRSALQLAIEYDCESVAFPLISAGTFGYPKDKALQVATETIGQFLSEHDLMVYLVVFGSESVTLSRTLQEHVQEYIDDHYVELNERANRRDGSLLSWNVDEAVLEHSYKEEILPEESAPLPPPPMPSAPSYSPRREYAKPDVGARFDDAEQTIDPVFSYEPHGKDGSEIELSRLINQLDESFQQMLLRLIDEKGLTDAQCYKKANVDRKLFSKIRKDMYYKPSKATAIAFAIALELNLDETKDLLMKAGYALSHSNKFDVIIEFFILHRNYNIFEINETLFYYDQSLLGA